MSNAPYVLPEPAVPVMARRSLDFFLSAFVKVIVIILSVIIVEEDGGEQKH